MARKALAFEAMLPHSAGVCAPQITRLPTAVPLAACRAGGPHVALLGKGGVPSLPTSYWREPRLRHLEQRLLPAGGCSLADWEMEGVYPLQEPYTGLVWITAGEFCPLSGSAVARLQ